MKRAITTRSEISVSTHLDDDAVDIAVVKRGDPEARARITRINEHLNSEGFYSLAYFGRLYKRDGTLGVKQFARQVHQRVYDSEREALAEHIMGYEALDAMFVQSQVEGRS